jgi:hypothetical protein
MAVFLKIEECGDCPFCQLKKYNNGCTYVLNIPR